MTSNVSSFRSLVEDRSLSQAERLAFIDYKIMYLGEVSRQDIIEEFSIGQAAASNDMRLYRELRPANSRLDHATKRTIITPETYVPLVNIDAHTALDFIKNGFCRSRLEPGVPSLPVETIDPRLAPGALNDEQVAAVTRAMKGQYGVECEYESRNSANTDKRVLFPIALFVDRQSWYVRAFDQGAARFKNFKLSRIKSTPCALGSDLQFPKVGGYLEKDTQWHTLVPLELVVADPENVQQLTREFGLEHGRKIVVCRAALIYFARVNWRIDVENGDKNIFYFKLANLIALKQMGLGDELMKSIKFGS